MGDGRKKLEITQDFLEKHRNNTRKYMHLLSKPNENSSSIQETLTRIESKFGLSIKRSNSHEVPLISEKPPENESIQDFIKQIRAKYLSSTDSEPMNSKPSLAETSTNDHPSELRRNKSQAVPEVSGLDLSTTDEKRPSLAAVLTKIDTSEKGQNLANLSEKLSSKIEKMPGLPTNTDRNSLEQLTIDDDKVLLLSDLVSEPAPSHFSPVSRPPRSKNPEEGHEEPLKEDPTANLHENSMSMSFRRVNAEQLLNSVISEVITKRLKIRKKPQNNPGAFSFESFLNTGKMKFAPLKKVVNFDQVFKNDEVLKGLLWRKQQVIKELERLEAEKVQVLELMNKV